MQDAAEQGERLADRGRAGAGGDAVGLPPGDRLGGEVAQRDRAEDGRDVRVEEVPVKAAGLRGGPSTTYVRVDVSPNAPTTHLRALARPEIDAYARLPGDSLIDLSNITVDGFPALHWEFVADEAGVWLHKEDDFFVDANGHGVAILTQSPRSEYSACRPLFAAIRQTLVMNKQPIGRHRVSSERPVAWRARFGTGASAS